MSFSENFPKSPLIHDNVSIFLKIHACVGEVEKVPFGDTIEQNCRRYFHFFQLHMFRSQVDVCLM